MATERVAEGDPAKSSVEAALSIGRSVVTANKALLAHHGVALTCQLEFVAVGLTNFLMRTEWRDDYWRMRREARHLMINLKAEVDETHRVLQGERGASMLVHLCDA